MDTSSIVFAVLLFAVVLVCFARFAYRYGTADAEQPQWELEWEYGTRNTALVCPHCQCGGKVRVKPVVQKAGISGGKATAAILTGGLSILATGLSRKQNMTQAHCDNCDCTWLF